MEEYDLAIRNRLLRVEGQIRGVGTMVAEGRPCAEIITQLSAVSSAITNVARVVLEHHIEEHCEIKGTHDENDEQAKEGLKKAVESFAKMK